MALQATQNQPQITTYGLDFLYCHEEILADLKLSNSKPKYQPNQENEDQEDEIGELVFLLSKEGNEQQDSGIDRLPLMKLEGSLRKDSVEWMVMVNAQLGFSSSTVVLAVNLFDRFMFSKCIENGGLDWVYQLVSVACLALAGKIQETVVPILLDFQIDCKYVFQPKTVMKMELLVMSTLEWKLNPVTPFSYFEHLTKRVNWKSYWQQEILTASENLLLTLIADPGYLCFTPSVVAASVVLHAMGELELYSPMESEILSMDAFKISKEKVEECCKFISKLTNNSHNCKRRRI